MRFGFPLWRVPRPILVGASRLAKVGVCLITLATFVVRGTVRDSVEGWHWLFYGAPWPVLAIASGVCLVIPGWRWLGSFGWPARIWVGGWGLLAAFAAIEWAAQREAWMPPPNPDPETVEVLLWNIQRRGEDESLQHAVRALGVDLVVVLETGGLSPEDQANWRKNLPEHQVEFSGGGFLVASRGDLSEVERHRPVYMTSYWEFEASLRGQNVQVMAVDLASDPGLFRRDYIRQSARFARELTAKGPTLYLGDFNTPPDSVWLEEVRESFQDAFESVGDGPRATWPRVFPVLQLDHVFASPDMELLRCRHLPGAPSDHRRVLLEFRFAPDGDGG